MKDLDLNKLHTSSNEDQTFKKYYKEIIEQALNEAGSRTALAEVLLCSPSRISEWKTGKVEMGGLRFSRLIMFILSSQKERGEIPKIKFGENIFELSRENGLLNG